MEEIYNLQQGQITKMASVFGRRKRIPVTNLASYCIGDEFTFFFFLCIQENIWEDINVQKINKREGEGNRTSYYKDRS